LEKPLSNTRKLLAHYQEKIQISKSQKNQCKTIALNCINFFLNNPNFLEFIQQVKITLQKCIMNKIRLGESVYPMQIIGSFITPEKNYLIDAAKIQMMWKGVHDYLKKKRQLARKYKNENVMLFRSELIYPSKEQSVVSFCYISRLFVQIFFKNSPMNISQIVRFSTFLARFLSNPSI
jgi:hypothetical protein